METKDFLDMAAQGNAVEAKDFLNDLLTARAFEALEARKAEIATTMYGEPQPESEEPVDPENPVQDETTQ